MEFDLETLASRVGGRLDGDGTVVVRGVAGIADARSGDITFLARDRFLPHLDTTGATALIARDGVETTLPVIRAEDPYLAFLKVIEAFARPIQELFPPGIHERAEVDPSAQVGEGVHVGPQAVVGPRVILGDHTVVGAGTVVMPDTRVGSRCLFYPNVTVREDCRIGDRVILHPGVVVGSDGFGFAKGEGMYHKIPQIGQVILEDDVEVGANTCIDRATTGRTIIAAGTKLDNLVQIAHNVSVGRHSVISAQSGVSGSTSIGDDVVIAGQVGIADHLRVGDRVQLAARAGVTNDVAEDRQFAGFPAREVRAWRRASVHFDRLDRYVKEIAELRRRLTELEKAERGQATKND